MPSGVGVLLEREQADLRSVAVRDHQPGRVRDRGEHGRDVTRGAKLDGRRTEFAGVEPMLRAALAALLDRG
jgi:hypothetical protein